ncbi:hypothetical protein WN51_09974 [Melipona quadrifasciata]|uniref:Uncharacterized protein n=1 Tax=Melipona quadrifasciata TaxID=166423 RepID=A0A0M9ADQ7_9HYME|nr:hypothetical protein WN51_09974 [Melipona quadrifasciata]
MVFDPSIKNCVPSTNFICKITSTSTTPYTKLIRAPEQPNGRFQITGDTTCKKYYFSYTDAVTTIRYNLTCPNNLQFNPITQRCVLPCIVSNKCPPCS